MKYYQITKFDPQVTDAFVRLAIDQYFHEKKYGYRTNDLETLAAIAFLHLHGYPVEYSKVMLMELMAIVDKTKKYRTPNRDRDYALLDNWHRDLKHGKPKQSIEQLPAKLNCEWEGEDPAMGCFVMLGWAKEELNEWFEDEDLGTQAAAMLVNQLRTLAMGQLTHQNDHMFMTVQDLEVVCMHAITRLLRGRMHHFDAEAYKAIKVLITMSQLIFKLRNGMSLRLKTNITDSGVIQINHASGTTTANESN
ncbi:MAG: hypothetical protein E6R09_05775 [Rhodocyclaceae bacterium]|jgi:hypothetical protein|nr:MAG: hypothetical protein E6R09_05775 [Rhodocyclaceae bacterium]